MGLGGGWCGAWCGGGWLCVWTEGVDRKVVDGASD